MLFRSDLDHAIPFDKVPAAPFQASGRVTDDMLRALRERSAARVVENEDFRKLQADIAQYEKRKNEKTISLVESEFEKQWNAGKAADEEEKKLEQEMDAQRRPVVKRDYYFDEAMNVTTDYLNSLAGGAAGLARTSRPVEAQIGRAHV